MKLKISIVLWFAFILLVHSLARADSTTQDSTHPSVRPIKNHDVYERGFVSSRYSCATYTYSGLTATSQPVPPEPCASDEITTNVIIGRVQPTKAVTSCNKWGCDDDCDWYDASCWSKVGVCYSCIGTCTAFSCSCPMKKCMSSSTVYQWTGVETGEIMTKKLICSKPGWVKVGSSVPTPPTDCPMP